jgi:hypothetical protein
MLPKFNAYQALPFLCLLLGTTCRKETITTVQPKDYFDCNAYNYYPQNTPYPSYTLQDSIAVAQYMLRQGADSAYIANPSFSETQYLSRVWGECDTVLYDKLFRHYNVKAYRSLSRDEQFQLAVSNAVVTGTVVAVTELVDADRCFLFKTLMAVKIDEVVHTFGNLKLHKNDVVLIGGLDGLAGGCNPNYDPEKETRQITIPYRHFKNGDYDLFLLSRNAYRLFFFAKDSEYDDVYCPNMFRLTDDFESSLNKNIKESVADIKRFFKEN